MPLFKNRRRGEVGSVRYLGWEEQEPPEPDTGDHMVTSHDTRRHNRERSVTGPSGHQYRFRGEVGRPSQWLPVRSIEDLDAFRDADEFEVKVELS